VADRQEHLTPAQKAALENELALLEGPKRSEVVQAIKTARGFGDLSENFEYHAAKNEQGLLERRIAILRNRLQNAVLIDEEAVAASESVVVGSRVTVEGEDGEIMDVEISSVGGVSPESPLGSALIGTSVGDEIVVGGELARPRDFDPSLVSVPRHSEGPGMAEPLLGCESLGIGCHTRNCRQAAIPLHGSPERLDRARQSWMLNQVPPGPV
jgi:transcription elongation factor GreA